MIDWRQTLHSALRAGPNPLCIDLDDASTEGRLRSSNGEYSVPLPRADIEAAVRFVKELAQLELLSRRAQSGQFVLDNTSFTVNCCPQMRGEILVVHRPWVWGTSSH